MSYQLPDMSLWKGRKTHSELGPQYWHQVLEPLNLEEEISSFKEIGNDKLIALLGYACEEGVKRNLGRLGAAQGPNAIRKSLAKLAYHEHTMKMWDAGTISCENQNLEQTQANFAEKVSKILGAGILPIGLGGGHDMAYAHGKGIMQFLEDDSEKKLGIINLDAHFDLRPIENEANSGTPFRQLLDEYPDRIGYFALGIQKASNTPSLFEFADAQPSVRYALLEENGYGRLPLPTKLLEGIRWFIKAYDYLYLTIDLDGFSSAFAPGVSAPSPFGWSPEATLELINPILRSGKLISFDLAELSPPHDRDEQTALLAARLIAEIIDRL